MSPRGILKACTVAVLLEKGSKLDARQIQNWVEANGGTFSASVNDKITHLICTPEHYKNSKAIILKQTDRFRSLKIVQYDWLEDSLHKKSKQGVRPYLLEKPAEKKDRKRKAKQKKLLFSTNSPGKADGNFPAKAFEKACVAFSERKSKEGYHIYRDDSGFAYNVLLGRKDRVKKNGSCNRGVLRLYESDSEAEPKTYGSFLVTSAPGGRSFTDVVAPQGCSLILALAHFKRYFQLKTGLDWDRRDCDQTQQEEEQRTEWTPWKYMAFEPEPMPDKEKPERPEGKDIALDSSHDKTEW